MTLTPPARIRGPLPHYTDAALRAERLAWIAKVPDAVPAREIGLALGITTDAASKLRRKARSTPAPRRWKYRLCGIQLGIIGRAIRNIPAADLDALERIAAQRGVTIADALAASWVEMRRGVSE